jgi:hypothetical protein
MMDINGEIWKKIDKHEHYKISNYGRIKNNKNVILKLQNKTYLSVGLWENKKLLNIIQIINWCKNGIV